MSIGVQNTLSQLQNATARVQFQQGQKNLGTTNMTQSGFLQLLMAQMKYQDPTNPTDDQAMISEEAQFTQIDSLNNLNKTMTQTNQISQASSIVGKNVQITQSDGTTSTGQVSSVSIGSDGTVGLKVNGQTYSMSQISQIFAN